MRVYIACIATLLFFASSTAYAQNYAKYSDIKPGITDLELEHAIVWQTNKRASALRCRENYTDAKVTSTEWEIEYNEEGFETGRHIHAVVYGETYDGKCGVAHCVFMQRVRADNTYTPKLKLVEMGDFYNLMCE